MSAGGAEREARASDTIWHDKAQQVWDEIFDDDECCEGHPEGVEYHEEPVVKRLAAFGARCANEARLEALEQAAQVCNDVAQQETIRTQGHPTSGAYEVGSRNCAEAIRALKAAPLDPPGGPHAT